MMVQWIAGLWSLIPVSRRSPGGGNGNPLQLFSHGKSHGQRSQPCYSLWGHKELNLTEHAHTHIYKSDLTDTYQVLHQKKKKRENCIKGIPWQSGLSVFTTVAWVQFLVRELRSHKPQSVETHTHRDSFQAHTEHFQDRS